MWTNKLFCYFFGGYLHVIASSLCITASEFVLKHNISAANNFRFQMGWTALMMASSAGRKEVVEFLLERGADAKCRNGNGQNCLHYAASKGHFEVRFGTFFSVTTQKCH